ncbi:tetratricopeptide repeat protein [Sodaliphilus sp.]|uniref:tetratricopeptide repeat protein n=1 Tax=Sodaliphilus sp. TaxID=2815818 RepID=UPI00388DF90B
MTRIDDIKRLLGEGLTSDAIDTATALLERAGISDKDRATAYYLRGNAHRKAGDWRLAMNDYLEGATLEPDGPAAMAYNHAQEILNFYHKDLYNP